MTEKWDCYSPVAMVLWRAADFAEAGDVDGPISKSIAQLGARDVGYDALALADVLRYQFLPATPEICVAWAMRLRELAEFGPAGRSKAK